MNSKYNTPHPSLRCAAVVDCGFENQGVWTGARGHADEGKGLGSRAALSTGQHDDDVFRAGQISPLNVRLRHGPAQCGIFPAQQILWP